VAQKQNLTVNSLSRSFKVTRFGITEKLMTDCISPYNNAGITSSPQKCWKLPLSTTPLSFDTHYPGNLCKYPHKPYVARNQSHGLTLLPAIEWVHFHSNFCGKLWKTHLFCNGVRIGHSRSPKVVDFGTNRKDICDFLLVINSNFGPILHPFWYTATYWLKIEDFFYPTLILCPH